MNCAVGAPLAERETPKKQVIINITITIANMVIIVVMVIASALAESYSPSSS